MALWLDMWLLVGDRAGLYQETCRELVSSRISELALNIDLAGAASACAKLQTYSCWVICCAYLTISRTLPAAAAVRGTVGVLSPPRFCGGSRARLWAQVKVVLGMPDRSLLLSLGLATGLLLFNCHNFTGCSLHVTDEETQQISNSQERQAQERAHSTRPSHEEEGGIENVPTCLCLIHKEQWTPKRKGSMEVYSREVPPPF